MQDEGRRMDICMQKKISRALRAREIHVGQTTRILLIRERR
jgi:hypothetical protein